MLSRYINQKTPDIIKGFSYLCNNQTTKIMTKLKEIWVTIALLPYEVSNLGSIRNFRGKKLSQSLSNMGYPIVCLSSNNNYKNYSVHRIVAIHFIPNPANKPQVNHKDGNKENNTVSNLEWVTPSENCIHAAQNGLRNTFGERCHLSKLKEQDILDIRSSGCSNKELADWFNVYPSTIWKIRTKKTWKHL